VIDQLGGMFASRRLDNDASGHFRAERGGDPLSHRTIAPSDVGAGVFADVTKEGRATGPGQLQRGSLVRYDNTGFVDLSVVRAKDTAYIVPTAMAPSSENRPEGRRRGH